MSNKIPSFEELYDEMRSGRFDLLKSQFLNFKTALCKPEGLSEDECERQFKKELYEVDYQQGLGNIQKAKDDGCVYRSISTSYPVKFLSDLKKHGKTRTFKWKNPEKLRRLGIFWTWDKKKAFSYYGGADDDYNIILKAKIDPDCHINFKSTLRTSLEIPENEKEVQLYPYDECKKPVSVEEVTVAGDDMEWDAYL
jgi:phage-related protein